MPENNRSTDTNGQAPEQARGKDLRHLMEDSYERGEKFREEHQGHDVVQSVLNNDSPRNQTVDNQKPGRQKP